MPPEELKHRAEKYLNYARMILSVLRKGVGPLPEGSARGPTPSELSQRLKRAEGYVELHGLDEGIGRRIASLVIRTLTEYSG